MRLSLVLSTMILASCLSSDDSDKVMIQEGTYQKESEFNGSYKYVTQLVFQGKAEVTALDFEYAPEVANGQTTDNYNRLTQYCKNVGEYHIAGDSLKTNWSRSGCAYKNGETINESDIYSLVLDVTPSGKGTSGIPIRNIKASSFETRSEDPTKPISWEVWMKI